MNNIRYDNDGNVIVTAQEAMAAATKPKGIELTISYILEQLEKIQADTAHLREALDKSHGDAGRIIDAREGTNQQLIKLYSKMYDDIKPNVELTKEQFLVELAEKFKHNNAFGRELGEVLAQIYAK